MHDVDFPVSGVMDGIAAAEAAGFTPIKINRAVKRSINDHAILPMARRFRHIGHILQFIEFLGVGATNGWKMDSVLSSAKVIVRINGEHPL